MKREIKFRGLRINKNEWVIGFYYYRDWEDTHWIRVKKDYHFIDVLVKPESVGQFTGLKDSNGVDIYEGDILSVPDDWDAFGFMSGEKRAVIFKCGGYRLKPKVDTQSGYWLEDDLTFKIIGNIHEA